jgi:hypothetical protein
MDVKTFNIASLFDAATSLFAQPGIKLNSNTAGNQPAHSLLVEHFKENSTFRSIAKTFYTGTIDGSIFKTTVSSGQNYTIDEAREQADSKYSGLMLFALTLSKMPARSQNDAIAKLLKIGHNPFVCHIQRLDPAANPEEQVGVVVHVRKAVG